MGTGKTLDPRRRIVATLVVVVAAVAACGRAETPAGDELPELPPTTPPGATVPPPAEVAVCEPAPFAGQPAVGSSAEPDEDVLRWVDSRPDELAGVWWDASTEQLVVVAVDPDAAVAALADELGVEPGEGAPVRVEYGARSATELAALHARVAELGEYGLAPSSGRRVWDATVEIALEFLDDESLDAVRQVFADDLDAICVTGADPDTAPPEGPQPTEGDGWKLLHDEAGAGESYSADVAVDQAQYEALWATSGLSGEPPAVDFADEIVIRFGATFSGSCPEIRLDGVVIDREADTVTADLVLLGGNRDCTADDNPRSYVVAVDRDVLPMVPFTVSAYPDCQWCRDTVVDELGDPDVSDEPTDGALPGDDELPAVLAASAVRRVLVENSFGGGSPFDLVQVIDRLGTVDGMGMLDADDGRLLTDDEREAIAGALAPIAVEFVPPDVFDDLDPMKDPEGLAIVTLGAPSTLDGQPVVASQLWCGGLCGIGGANELVRAADGSWSIGEPVGMQWIS